MILLGLTASPLSSVAAKAKSGFNFLQYPHPAEETEAMNNNKVQGNNYMKDHIFELQEKM